MVHLISGMLYTWGLNEAPTRVMAMGGIRRFNDGRNMPDVHMSLFEYRRRPGVHPPEPGFGDAGGAPLPRLEGHPRAHGRRA